MNLDDVIEYIICEYSFYKIRFEYNTLIDNLIDHDPLDEHSIYEEKIKDYNEYYNNEIENYLVDKILTSVNHNFKTNKINKEIDDFIINYLYLCLPNFRLKMINERNKIINNFKLN